MRRTIVQFAAHPQMLRTKRPMSSRPFGVWVTCCLPMLEKILL